MIKHVRPVSRSAASGGVSRVYEQMRREFGIHAEPIVLHSPAPELMFGAWALCRETLVAAGRVDRASKEAVATTISQINRCPFCVDAHAAMLAATGDYRTARKLERGALGSDNPALASLVGWAAATRSPGAPVLRKPPFGPEAAPELIGTALLFHYVNRPVSVFLGESPFPLDGRLFRGGMLRIGGRRFREVANARPAAGESLDLLPEAELPQDMTWARGSPVVAAAWARFAAAVERAGADALEPDVRALVAGRLAGWAGEDPPLGAAWLDEATADLSVGLRPAARLALLVALAPYRVDERVVESYRDGRPDSEVVGTVAWSALTAARRIGRWLVPAGAESERLPPGSGARSAAS